MEPLVLRSASGAMRLRFAVAKMHSVASALALTPVTITVDDRPTVTFEISRPTLYTLFDDDAPGEHLLDLAVGAPA